MVRKYSRRIVSTLLFSFSADKASAPGPPAKACFSGSIRIASCKEPFAVARGRKPNGPGLPPIKPAGPAAAPKSLPVEEGPMDGRCCGVVVAGQLTPGNFCR